MDLGRAGFRFLFRGCSCVVDDVDVRSFCPLPREVSRVNVFYVDYLDHCKGLAETVYCVDNMVWRCLSVVSFGQVSRFVVTDLEFKDF